MDKLSMRDKKIHPWKKTNILPDYSAFPKEYTVSARGWELLMARLFGRKFDEPRCTAYLYKGKFYFTRLI